MKASRNYSIHIDQAQAWLTRGPGGRTQLELHLWSNGDLFRLVLSDHAEARQFIDQLIKQFSVWLPAYEDGDPDAVDDEQLGEDEPSPSTATHNLQKPAPQHNAPRLPRRATG